MRPALNVLILILACVAAPAAEPVVAEATPAAKDLPPPQLIADFVAAARKSPEFAAWSALTATAVGAEAQGWAKTIDLPVVVERADFGCFTGPIQLGGKYYYLTAPSRMEPIQDLNASSQPLLWRLDARSQIALGCEDHTWFIDESLVKDLIVPDAVDSIVVQPPLARRVDFTVERESLTRVIQKLAGLAKCDYSVRNDLADAITVTLALHDQPISACVDAIAPTGWTVDHDGPQRISAPVWSIVNAYLHRDDLNRQLPQELRIQTPVDACRAVVFDAAETIKRAPRTMINVRGPQPKPAN